jgi:hypothetical protein
LFVVKVIKQGGRLKGRAHFNDSIKYPAIPSSVPRKVNITSMGRTAFLSSFATTRITGKASLSATMPPLAHQMVPNGVKLKITNGSSKSNAQKASFKFYQKGTALFAAQCLAIAPKQALHIAPHAQGRGFCGGANAKQHLHGTAAGCVLLLERGIGGLHFGVLLQHLAQRLHCQPQRMAG